MKIYDFKCPACDHVQEKMVKDQSVQPPCVKCETPMIRLMSAPGMVKTNFADKTGFKTRK